jgi:hypothetical protein
MTNKKKQSTEAAVREIRRRTRRKFAPEEKVRIVLEGLPGGAEHFGALPPRRHRSQSLLPLEQRLPGGRQEAAGRRHGSGSHQHSGQGGAVNLRDAVSGSEIGVRPSIAVVDEGLAGSLAITTDKDEVYVFFFGQKGLLGGPGLKDGKITVDSPGVAIEKRNPRCVE